MRRQIIIRNKFARTIDQKFRKGQKVYFTMNYGNGPEYPATIVGVGSEKGDVVYDVRLDYEGANTSVKWGYEDQFRARDGVANDERPEDEAYRAGANSRRTDVNPYATSEMQAAWERGRKVRKQTEKFASSARQGEWPVGPGSKRTGFRAPAPQRDAGTGTWEVEYVLLPSIAKREGVAPNQGEAFSDVTEARKEFEYRRRSGECSRVTLKDPYGKKVQGDSASRDFNSERGWIARVLSSNGRVVAESEPFLSDGPAKEWLDKQIDKAARLGFYVTGKVSNGYFDPSRLSRA